VSVLLKLLRLLLGALVVGGFLGLVAATAAYFYLVPKLPDIEVLKDVRLQVPLRVYTRDGLLMAEFGEKRRVPLTVDQIPKTMIEAVIAAEDEHFYDHPGVDWQGLVRAVLHLVRTGEKGPGGSTITMQVARNFFLGREKTYVRKANEILLALKIERELGKDEILELYLNKIFLGHRAYGVGAAARVYYGTELADLTLAQVAMIAGLPKAPSRFNPVADPERALARRNYVLGRMRELGYIDENEYAAALETPISAKLHGPVVEAEAPYVAEMVRATMEARAGEEAYTAGYKVYTTIDSRLQAAANAALREALLEYDERHGWRGPELTVELAPGTEPAAVLGDIPVIGSLVPALVTAVEERAAHLYARDLGPITLPFDALAWARPYIHENRRGPAPESVADVLAPGDIVRVRKLETEPDEEAGDGGATRWRLAQAPEVEGAIVSLAPRDGAIEGLAGGFDFYRSKFNRATQAERQPGSAFKPFIYSAALERGFTPATLINDAPVVFDDPGLEAEWRPENYSGEFFGPTRLREALVNSRNLVSIRLLRAIGIEAALEHMARFGFDPARLPPTLSLALGSGTVTPLELASAYTVFANGGYRVEPYFIRQVLGPDGERVLAAAPPTVCPACEARGVRWHPAGETTDLLVGRVEPTAIRLGAARLGAARRPAPRTLSAQNAWIMSSILRDVVQRGTGRRARALGREDLAGKTGTTNDQRDAWFSGFTTHLVTTAWVGFDQLRELGARETGARAALPMWVAFMEEALEGAPTVLPQQPEGLVTVRIDPESGQRVGPGYPEAVFEVFRADSVPPELVEVAGPSGRTPPPDSSDVTEQLF